MNSIETIMLNFIKSELIKNPQLAATFLAHLLDKTKMDPTLEKDLLELFTQLLPTILEALK